MAQHTPATRGAYAEGFTRPTLRDEAERLLSYWEQHGDKPEAVAKWAATDMLGILRYIVEEQS